MRRFLYLFIVIAVIALIVLIGYFLRGGAKPEGGATGNLPGTPTQQFPRPTPSTPAPAPPGAQPSPLGTRFGAVAQNKVMDFFVDSQNGVVLVQPDGQVVRVINGESSILSSSAIANLREVRFSYDGKRVLAVFGDQSGREASIFNVLSKSWQPLASNLKTPTWSPNSYQIAYLLDKGDVAALTTLDTANPKAKPLELAKLHLQDVSLNWQVQNKIIVSEKPSAFPPGSIWSFDIKLKTLTPLAENKLGLESVWSGGAELGLTFSTDPTRRGGKLSLVDGAGNALNDLAFLTLPSKCAFDIQQIQGQPPQSAPAKATSTNKTTSTKTSTSTAAAAPLANKFLYCAIPKDPNKLKTSRLPDDYEKRVLFTADDFFRINLNLGAPGAGNVEPVFSGSGRLLDASQVKIFNKTVFFVNRLDQQLYAISLK